MSWKSPGAFALALATLAVVAAPAAGQVVKPRAPTLDAEVDPVDVLTASPTSVGVTAGG